MSKEQQAVDEYLNTIKRLEPDIHPIDTAAGWASVAISLKRIADGQERLIELLSCLEINTRPR